MPAMHAWIFSRVRPSNAQRGSRKCLSCRAGLWSRVARSTLLEGRGCGPGLLKCTSGLPDASHARLDLQQSETKQRPKGVPEVPFLQGGVMVQGCQKYLARREGLWSWSAEMHQRAPRCQPC